MTVYFDIERAPRVNEGNNRAIYQRAAQAGATIWQQAGNGIGSVSLVGNANSADIYISWAESGLGSALGQARPQSDGSFIGRQSVIALDGPGFSNLAQTALLEEAVKYVIAHEMGHVLFLTGGHSPFAGDLMHGIQNVTTLTQRDINTIREAYCK